MEKRKWKSALGVSALISMTLPDLATLRGRLIPRFLSRAHKEFRLQTLERGDHSFAFGMRCLGNGSSLNCTSIRYGLRPLANSSKVLERLCWPGYECKSPG